MAGQISAYYKSVEFIRRNTCLQQQCIGKFRPTRNSAFRPKPNLPLRLFRRGCRCLLSCLAGALMISRTFLIHLQFVMNVVLQLRLWDAANRVTRCA
jgi:hypothetical protein